MFAVIAALAVEYLSQKKEVREDSIIGIIWSLGMAIGIIFIFLTPGYVPDLNAYFVITSYSIHYTKLYDW